MCVYLMQMRLLEALLIGPMKRRKSATRMLLNSAILANLVGLFLFFFK